MCWHNLLVVKAHAKILFVQVVIKEKSSADMISQNILLTLPCVGSLVNRLFQTWYGAEHL